MSEIHNFQPWLSRNQDSKSVVLEMGHIYLYPAHLGRADDEIVTNEELQGAKIGLELYALLQSQGVPVQSMLFVDDLHGRNVDLHTDNSESTRRLALALERFSHIGFEPDVIVSEADMTPAAAHLYGMLVMNGVLQGTERHLPKAYGQSLLFHPQTNEMREPSCSLIDAALYKKKLGAKKGEATMTVLPESYRSQQRQVKNILRAVGDYFPSISILYFSQDGALSLDDWSQRA